MNEFLKVLLNIRSLRAAIRELPFEQLQEAKEKFELVYNERAESVEQERAEQEERQRKLSEFTEMLQQAGIDPRELLNSAAARLPLLVRPRASAPRVLPSTSTRKMARRKPGPVKAVCRKPLPNKWHWARI